MKQELTDKIFWLYHKDTKEPLPCEINDRVIIDDSGNFNYYKNNVQTLFPKDYELRFHRKNIKFAGLSLTEMLDMCAYDNEPIHCIWDNWKSEK